MKNYEEKYNEAFKRAKSIYCDAKKEHLTHTDWLENIFPELIESKDEKIRRELLDYLNEREILENLTETKVKKEWISWLENQKPVEWGEEDSDMTKETIYFINEFQKSDRCKDENDMQNSVTCEDWLKSLKPQPHWKPSEEQIEILIKVRRLLHNESIYKESNKILYQFEELIRTLENL